MNRITSLIQKPCRYQPCPFSLHTMPEQHAHVLYTKLLLSRGHGYPLWTPEPDYSLCSAYVGRGICVGDVGIIRDDGGFDFIFNAFLEADDPVHEGGVPPNFSPLRTESPNPIRTIYFQHPRDSSVRSSHVSVKSVIVEASAEVPCVPRPLSFRLKAYLNLVQLQAGELDSNLQRPKTKQQSWYSPRAVHDSIIKIYHQ